MTDFEELPEPGGGLSILHVFADKGVEAEVLGKYGDAVRIGLNAVPNDASQGIKADANFMPIKPGVTFDLGVFHPPCGQWADLTSITGDPEGFPDLIPLSRETRGYVL